MDNPNALVSLAYIKSCENPLKIFCNYILYVLMTSKDQILRIDEIRDLLLEEFGLRMPVQMLNTCMRILEKDREVNRKDNGAGFSVGITNFNISNFENQIQKLHEQEAVVLSSLINYVKSTYKLDWTEEQSRSYLSNFMGNEGNAARLFLRQEINEDINKLSPSWFIGRYISSVQEKEDSLEKKYLEDIVKGMMIYIGINQTNDYRQDSKQKFKGTTFYFDTKLILRLLGYSWSALVESVRELYELITKDYGGQIKIFPQTLTEVKNALDKAGRCFQRDSKIFDPEISFYSKLNPDGASLLVDKALVIDAILAKEYNIHLSEQVDWDKDSHHGIDIEEITDYIYSKHPGWRKGTISYDVEIINQVNIQRQSDYSIRFGGSRKRPVFITSNSDLVYAFRDYVVDETENNLKSFWNVHALPVISDSMILFRLWLPCAKQHSNLPAITLSRFAYAAQNPDTQFFHKLRDTAVAYEKEAGISLLDLNEARRRLLEDILAVQTGGDADNLTTEIIATSVDELVAIENINLTSQLSDSQNRNKEQESIISEKDRQIVNLIAKQYIEKIGIGGRAWVFISKFWWAILPVLLFIARCVIDNYIDSISIINNKFSLLITVLPVAVQLVFVVLDKAIDRLNLQYIFLKKAVKRVWKKYTSKIEKELSSEHDYLLSQVVEKCRDETGLFKMHEKYCEIE